LGDSTIAIATATLSRTRLVANNARIFYVPTGVGERIHRCHLSIG
jgi:hypothetical protein